MNVTSSVHIAQGNCNVGPGLDYMSPHEPMMIAATEEKACYMVLYLETLVAWKWLTVGVCFLWTVDASSVRVLRLVLGLVDGSSCTCYLHLGISIQTVILATF